MARTKHSGNGHDRLHVTETPDVSHIKNPDVTHEASDVSVSGVAKFVVALTALCAVVFVLMWGMFRFLNAQETEKEPPPGPMAMKPEERLPPDPKLQAAPGFGVTLKSGEWVKLEKREPEAEYRVLLAQWERELKCTEGTELKTKHEGPDASAPSGASASGETSHKETGGGGQDARAPRGSSAPEAPCVPIDQAMQQVIGLPARVKANAEKEPGGLTEDSGIDRPTAASSGRATEKGKKSER